MGSILEVVKQFLTQDEWTFSEGDEGSLLSLGISGQNGQWQCYAKAREAEYQFVFYSVCSAQAAEDCRPALAEFVARANFGLVIGNFELDLDTGEVRYKTSIDVEGDRLTPPLVQNVVYANVVMMDRYLPGIMAVLGGTTPAEALKMVEEA